MWLYSIFAFFDNAIYSMVKFGVRLIMLIANYDFFQEPTIDKIANKIYVVLGVLMLFKIVISAIQYMVNPDTFDDKDKGMGGILKKTVICMALLVLIKPVFNFAMYMQKSIVSTIPGLILNSGKDYKIEDNSANNPLDEIGNKVSGTTIKAFVSLKEDRAKAGKSDEIKEDLDSFNEHIRDGCNGSLTKGLDLDLCDYDYKFGLSTAAGIFLLYVILSMAIDVGIRAIKLGILQIFAPIPISSYIVSKDKLSKFFKLAINVYVDLFIRLIVIYFIIFFISEIINNMGNSVTIGDGYTATPFETAFVKIAIIVALFMFAKNAPKFISEVLGISGDGIGDMKDMFTRGGGLLGTTAAGFRTARSNYTTQKERAFGKGMSPKRQIAEGLRSAAAGFASSTGRGLWMTGQGKGFKDVRQNASKAAINARNRRNDRVDNLYNRERYIDAVDENGNYILDANGNRQQVKNPEYYGYMDYRRDVKREKLGIPSSEAFIKARYDAMEKIAKTAADAKGHGVGKMNETPNRYQISFRDSKGQFASSDFANINRALGYESLSMEQVRNLYTMAKNGQEFDIIQRDSTGRALLDASGKVVTARGKLQQTDIDSLGTLVQTIEKRTSYMKEAELMATGDPAASPNVDKLVIGLKTNRDMFNAREIMTPIIGKMDKDLKNFRINPGNPDDHRVRIEGMEFDPSNYNGLLDLVQHLQTKLEEPKSSGQKYVNMKNSGASDSQIAAELAADRKAYFETIAARADILTGIKDSFEEVAKTQYKSAQIADNKAQKAQKAVSNNDKKG